MLFYAIPTADVYAILAAFMERADNAKQTLAQSHR
jgi:hypothetical protein